jgi:predicted kinase
MKYEPLCRYLDLQSRAEIILPFTEVEAILGTSLPPSAYKYPAWWANEENPLTAHGQCSAWLSVGYKAFPNLPAAEIRFVRKPAAFRPSPTASPRSPKSADRWGSADCNLPTATHRPMLVVFSGLSGTGKTTIGRQLAENSGATYLSVDEIEQAIWSAQGITGDIASAAYTVAYAMAEGNLRLGRMVVSDSVNPDEATRRTWRATAMSSRASLVEVELHCSDLTEHRFRIEKRASDIPGLRMPSWYDVKTAKYQLWTEPHLTVDTTRVSVANAVQQVLGAMLRASGAHAPAAPQGVPLRPYLRKPGRSFSRS